MRKLIALPLIATLIAGIAIVRAEVGAQHFAAIIATNNLPTSVVLEKQAELAAYLLPTQIDVVSWVPVSNTVTHIKAFATYEWVSEMERVKSYSVMEGTNTVSKTSGAPVSQTTVDDANEGMDPDLFISALTDDFTGWLESNDWVITPAEQ